MRGGFWSAALVAAGFVGTAQAQAWRDECRTGETLDECRTRLGVRSEAQADEEKIGDKAGDLGRAAADEAREVRREGRNALEELGDAMSGGEELGRVRNDRPVKNQIIVDPVGTATGDGLNVQYGRPLGPRWNKWLPLAYGRYSQTDIADGNVGRLGLNVGADYFVFGRNAEGFRVGPRVGVIGGYDNRGDNEYIVGGLLGGEAGYTFVATNGVTAAGGLGLEFTGAGSLGDNSGFDGDSNPYARLQLGYSW